MDETRGRRDPQDRDLDRAHRDRYDDYGFGLWAMQLGEAGPLVGDCGLTMQRVDDALDVEVGYHGRGGGRGSPPRPRRRVATKRSGSSDWTG